MYPDIGEKTKKLNPEEMRPLESQSRVEELDAAVERLVLSVPDYASAQRTIASYRKLGRRDSYLSSLEQVSKFNNSLRDFINQAQGLSLSWIDLKDLFVDVYQESIEPALRSSTRSDNWMHERRRDFELAIQESIIGARSEVFVAQALSLLGYRLDLRDDTDRDLLGIDGKFLLDPNADTWVGYDAKTSHKAALTARKSQRFALHPVIAAGLTEQEYEGRLKLPHNEAAQYLEPIQQQLQSELLRCGLLV